MTLSSMTNTMRKIPAPGEVGITIEIQEYDPATGTVVTVVPKRCWDAARGVLRERAAELVQRQETDQ
jgi:hypothetical protein